MESTSTKNNGEPEFLCTLVHIEISPRRKRPHLIGNRIKDIRTEKALNLLLAVLHRSVAAKPGDDSQHWNAYFAIQEQRRAIQSGLYLGRRVLVCVPIPQ